MDNEKSKEFECWFLIAEEDIRAANHLMKANPPFVRQACFHAQQCTEKSLKGYLSFKGVGFKRIHKLAKLMEECGNHDMEFMKFASQVSSTVFSESFSIPANSTQVFRGGVTIQAGQSITVESGAVMKIESGEGMTEYAEGERYPEKLRKTLPTEAFGAIDTAEKILAFAKAKVMEPGMAGTGSGLAL